MENMYVTAIENHNLLQNFFHRTQHAGPKLVIYKGISV